MSGTVEKLYNNGIRASLENKTNASPSEVDTYINSTNMPAALHDQWNSPPVFSIPVKFESGANFETKLQQIISQKWLALYPDGWEAWSERRRTGYPLLYPIIQSTNPNIPVDAIVRRVEFSIDEYLNNSKEVQNAIKLLRTTKDGRLVRLWWDAKGQ